MDDVNCDSQYKCRGPHIGVLCRTQFVRGEYELLDRLRPAPGDPPGKADRLRPCETGT